MPNHTSKQCISIRGPSGDPKSARKRVANPRNIATIMPAPQTLQEFPRQEAAEDAAQRDNQGCTHHDSRNQNINPSRPAENPQEEGCSGARRTTKPGTEGEAKPRSAVRQEIIRVDKGISQGRRRPGTNPQPKTLGNEEKFLTKTICVERNGVPSRISATEVRGQEPHSTKDARADTKHRKAQKLEPREEIVRSSNSKFKIPEPSRNFKIQKSKPRTIDSETVTREKERAKQLQTHECSCPPVPPWKITQTIGLDNKD